MHKYMRNVTGIGKDKSLSLHEKKTPHTANITGTKNINDNVNGEFSLITVTMSSFLKKT